MIYQGYSFGSFRLEIGKYFSYKFQLGRVLLPDPKKEGKNRCY